MSRLVQECMIVVILCGFWSTDWLYPWQASPITTTWQQVSDALTPALH